MNQTYQQASPLLAEKRQRQGEPVVRDDWKGEALIRSVEAREPRSMHANRRPPGETGAMVRDCFDRGMSAAAIAAKLGIGRDTVHWHCSKQGLSFRRRDAKT